MVTMVLIMLIRKKSFKDNLPERTSGKYLFLSLVAFFFIGVYGGFINAGIGFIIMFFLNQVNRLTLVKTNATKNLLLANRSLNKSLWKDVPHLSSILFITCLLISSMQKYPTGIELEESLSMDLFEASRIFFLITSLLL